MGDNEGHGDLLSNNLVILLIAMGSAAFVVSMYHVIAICWCNQRITNQNQQQQQRPSQTTEGTSLASVANMIPTHRYSKKKVDSVVQGRSNCDGGDDGDTCAVCLGDFEDGEELRTMPECMHSFHVACIDMWLSSHSSCPICRSSATPSQEVLHSDHDFNYAYQHQHSLDMSTHQFAVTHVMRR
ncbi:hypothetical protein GLYMA_09G214600v4 [Glycine max]|uniref:RING-type domain-containing protein n=1 Tax=Glycine max TaxID=3847 RepID=I1L574_SOYBN|nr:RING-H2 finger protein ATL72 [Glycine max]KAG5007879.1 hypothetical protein JHK85_026421 [Glycine max]KRH39691.1 hypothetical protein GLYMA_09G214600v4 [Glycine max]|eukprot:XP_006587641.1 RING-H2 finger protein ATL72 [Glycine max]